MKNASLTDNRDRTTALGIFLLSLAIYILLSPGRIDIIDGQFRYEVAHSLISHGSAALFDPALLHWGLPGVDGLRYSSYGLSGSLIAGPLLFVSQLLAPGSRDLEQAMFAMTSPLLAAATLGYLYAIYRSFGASVYSAMGWTFVFGFATLFMPLATSVFDQAQNAFCVLVSFYYAYAANRKRLSWQAVLGGAAFIALINYKEAYIVLWPGLLWAAGLRPGTALLQIKTNRTVQIYIAAGIVGLALWIAYNMIRFGQPFLPYISGAHPPLFGNTLIGLINLTISPGKGLLWYSPASLLAIFGWKVFWKKHPDLAGGIAIAIGLWTLLIASLSFSGGDWCWGPRYWVPVLPLIALAAPFVRFSRNAGKITAALVIGTSLGIQCLAISVDHQRFFFARSLPPFFWYENSLFYLNHSALSARLTELTELKDPYTYKLSTPFRPGPHPELLTYTIFGPSSAKELSQGDVWMQRYPVFSLPRPWPLWTAAIDDSHIKSLRQQAIGCTLAIALGGMMLIRFSVKKHHK